MSEGMSTPTTNDEAAFTLRPITGEPGWCHAVHGDGSYLRVREGFQGWDY
jgi:hypothetical protein